MEARQIVRPKGARKDGAGLERPQLPTFSGETDGNRHIVATAAWDLKYRRFTAGAAYDGLGLEVQTPVNLIDRIVYADIANVTGVPDVGTCLGELQFFRAGAVAFKLPFEFLPGNVTGNQEIGFHVTSAAAAVTPINTLGVDIGTTTRVFIPGWEIRIACSKIKLELRAGNADATNACYVILGCLSQGREE